MDFWYSGAKLKKAYVFNIGFCRQFLKILLCRLTVHSTPADLFPATNSYRLANNDNSSIVTFVLHSSSSVHHLQQAIITMNNKSVLLLVSETSFSRNVSQQQDWARNLLTSLGVHYFEIDGADPINKESWVNFWTGIALWLPFSHIIHYCPMAVVALISLFLKWIHPSNQ